MEIIQTHQYARLAGIAEQHHIAYHNTLVDGWNKTKGGDGYIPEIGWGNFGDKHPNWKGGLRTNDPNLYMRKYNQIPEVKAKIEEKRQTPEYKAKAREYQREYSQRPERKAYMDDYSKEYNQKPEVKERNRKRSQTPERKEYDRKRQQTPERKAYDKEYWQRPEVKLRANMNRRIRVARNLLNSPISL